MYPATHNFKDEADGTSGTDIDFVDSAVLYDGACEIVSEWQGHRKVLRLQDDATAAEDPYIVHNETQATSGVREFWMGSNDVSAVTFYGGRFAEGGTVLFGVYISAGNIGYLDNGGGNIIKAAADNTWYHVKVQWYADNTFDVWVDGVIGVAGATMVNNQVSGLNKCYVRHLGDSTNYGYFDAYGDPDNDSDYKIGDNIHWRHYKESTDDFEGDDVGTQGTSITWVDMVDTAASFEIVPEFNEHKKVLRGYYSSGAGGYDECTHTFITQSKNGWWAGWIKTTDATIQNYIKFFEVAVADCIEIRFNADKIQYYDGALADWVDALDPAVDNTWYFIYIQWYDAANDYFDLWINNILIASNIQCTGNQNNGIDTINIRCYSATEYLYIDAPISSLDSDVRGDNRLLDYNDSYTRDDITADVLNIIYSNKLGDFRKCTLYSLKEWDELYIFQVYDVNGKLAFEGEIKNRTQVGGLYSYPLRTKIWDEGTNRSSNIFTTAKIHDPAVSGSMLKTVLPVVGQADGDLILVNADTKTDTYSPVTKYYPDLWFLNDIADLADSCVIIEASGKVHLDDDLASGTVLDIDVAANKRCMLGDPRVTDILETINYFEIFGAIDPSTGSRFYKEVDNSGTDRKRRWRNNPNNNLRTQTDVDNYAAQLVARVIPVRSITQRFQGLGVHDMGTTIDYKFVTTVINIPQANYYIVEEIVNFEKNEHILVFSEGMVESSKYAATFEKPQEYTDAHAAEIYELDYTTIQLHPFSPDGTLTGYGWLLIPGDFVYWGFYIPSEVDPTRAITVYMSWYEQDELDIQGSMNVVKHPSDGATASSLIENALDHDVVFTANDTSLDTTYTLSASDIVNDTYYRFMWGNADGTGSINLLSVQVTYYIKKSLS